MSRAVVHPDGAVTTGDNDGEEGARDLGPNDVMARSERAYAGASTRNVWGLLAGVVDMLGL